VIQSWVTGCVLDCDGAWVNAVICSSYGVLANIASGILNDMIVF